MNVMFLPIGVFWKAWMMPSYAAWGVEYATIASSAAGSDFGVLPGRRGAGAGDAAHTDDQGVEQHCAHPDLCASTDLHFR